MKKIKRKTIRKRGSKKSLKCGQDNLEYQETHWKDYTSKPNVSQNVSPIERKEFFDMDDYKDFYEKIKNSDEQYRYKYNVWNKNRNIITIVEDNKLTEDGITYLTNVKKEMSPTGLNADTASPSVPTTVSVPSSVPVSVTAPVSESVTAPVSESVTAPTTASEPTTDSVPSSDSLPSSASEPASEPVSDSEAAPVPAYGSGTLGNEVKKYNVKTNWYGTTVTTTDNLVIIKNNKLTEKGVEHFKTSTNKKGVKIYNITEDEQSGLFSNSIMYTVTLPTLYFDTENIDEVEEYVVNPDYDVIAVRK